MAGVADRTAVDRGGREVEAGRAVGGERSAGVGDGDAGQFQRAGIDRLDVTGVGDEVVDDIELATIGLDQIAVGDGVSAARPGSIVQRPAGDGDRTGVVDVGVVDGADAGRFQCAGNRHGAAIDGRTDEVERRAGSGPKPRHPCW